MAKGLFIVGFSTEEVLAIQAKAKALLLEGKAIMSWSDGGGTSVTNQQVMSVAEVLEECAYALRKLDPATYAKRPAAPGNYVPHRLPL